VHRNLKRALVTTRAFRRGVETTCHSVIVARRAIVAGAAGTDKECDGAAVHTFPVNKLVTMRLTHLLAPVERLGRAFLAQKILLLELLFRLHSLHAIHHTSKVGALTIKALEEGAVVESEVSQLIVVDVALGNDSTRFVVAFLNGHQN